MSYSYKVLRAFTAFLAIGLCFMLLPVNNVFAQTASSISGTVTNGTSNTPAGGLLVTLTVFDNYVPVFVEQATTDDNGTYAFNDLAPNDTASYTVGTSYRDVPYNSDVIQLTTLNASQTSDFTVYETTNDSANVQITDCHIILVPTDPGVLGVEELWGIYNSGNLTYTGDNDANITARFSLPPGAMEFSGDTGINQDPTTGGVIDAQPVTPGSNSIVFMYMLPYSGNNAVFTRQMDYAISSLNVFVPQTGVTAKSASLTKESPQDLEGQTYVPFDRANLSAGQTIDLSLSISAAAFGPTSSSGNWISTHLIWVWVSGAIVVLGAALAVIFRVIKRRRPSAPSRKTGVVQGIDAEESILAMRIARLDDSFAAGEINESEYKTRRAKMKANLVELVSKKKLKAKS